MGRSQGREAVPLGNRLTRLSFRCQKSCLHASTGVLETNNLSSSFHDAISTAEKDNPFGTEVIPSYQREGGGGGRRKATPRRPRLHGWGKRLLT